MSFVSDTHEAIFVHVAKTGGRSVNVVLKRELEPELVFNTQTLDPDVDSLGRNIPTEVLAQIGPDKFDRYFKFAFVRNPWDRAVSTYEHLLDEYRDHVAKPRPRPREKTRYVQTILQRLGITLEELTFPRFVTDVLRDRVFDNYHWDLQSNVVCLPSGEVCMDFLGRFENLRRDFDTLKERLGVPHAVLPHLNRSQKDRAKRKHYSEYFGDPALAETIARIYARDIENFGYEFAGAKKS